MRIDPGPRRVVMLVLGLVAVAALIFWLRRTPPEPIAAPSRPEPARVTTTAPRVVADEPPAVAPPSPAPGEEVFVHQLPPGDGTGIHAFPRPGTKPIKTGIIVPEGYELPPGYVAHHQATDDGDQVPPILMFHPDYKPVDAQGRPIPLPEDRIVPPEMAPPGMPIQMLPPHPVRADLDEHGRPLQ